MREERRRILVTGGSGQVGEALRRTLAPLGEVIAPTSAELNLEDAGSIRSAMSTLQPRWVVNAGAYTAVDKAESEPERAHLINAVAPEAFGEEAARIGAAVIHFSTDYVFDGANAVPYVEYDVTGPLNVYGASKLGGEERLRASGAAQLIFRTSWVYGATGNNFVKTMLRLARERDHLKIVGDQHGGPTWSFALAQMAAHVIEKLENDSAVAGRPLEEILRPVSGIYHATGTGQTTWFGLAQQAIAELQKIAPEAKLASVEAIPTSAYPTPAKRPSNSRLDCAKLGRVFGWRMPRWEDSLALVVGELAQ